MTASQRCVAAHVGQGVDFDVLQQGSAGKIFLGFSPTKTIKSSGCILTSFAMARNILCKEKAIDPIRANDMIKAKDGFAKNSGAIRRTIACNTLNIELTSMIDHYDHKTVTRHIDDGGLAIVGVDYKGGRSSGISDADHFVLAFDHKQDQLMIADPATGRATWFCVSDGFYGGNVARLCEATLVR